MPDFYQGLSLAQRQEQAQTTEQTQSQKTVQMLTQRAELLETQIQDLQQLIDREIRDNCAVAADENDRLITPEEKNDIISDREWTQDANVPLDDNRDGMTEQLGDNFERCLSPGDPEEKWKPEEDEEDGEPKKKKESEEDKEPEPPDDFYEEEESSPYNYLNDGGNTDGKGIDFSDGDSEVTLRQDLMEQWTDRNCPEKLTDYADLIAANLNKNGYFFVSIDTLVSCISNAINIILDFDSNEDDVEVFTSSVHDEIQRQLQKDPKCFTGEERNFLNFVLNSKTLMKGILDQKNGRANQSIDNAVLKDNLTGAWETLRTFTPAGVAATSLQDCFTLQIQRTTQENPGYYTPETLETLNIILKKENEETLKKLLLLRNADAEEEPVKEALGKLKVVIPFAKSELCTEENAQNILLALQMLNPFPAKDFAAERDSKIQYVSAEPEVEVQLRKNAKGGTEPVVIPLKKMPRLYKSKSYMAIFNDPNTDAETKAYLASKISRINVLNAQIAERGSAVLHVANLIVDHQKEYFLTGDEKKLNSLTQTQIAREFIVYRKNEDGKIVKENGTDVSYISRVVGHSVSDRNTDTDADKRKKKTDTRKYMKTPYGIRSFEFFFNRMNTGNGKSSKEDIIEMIRDIVNNPPSDMKRMGSGKISSNNIMEELNRRLKEKGEPPLALKTVSNYRREANL